MFKIARYFRPFIGSIIAVVMLLIVQATCDLSLPEYTSDIVNIGIQQNGIKNAVPQAIRKSSLDKIMIFMSDEDRNIVQEKYKLLEKDNLTKEEYDKELKKYEALKEEGIYVLKDNEKDTIDILNKIMAKPEMIVLGIESGKLNQEMNIPNNKDVFTVFSNMPREQLDIIKKEINAKFDNIKDSMIVQSATQYVKKEYEDIGINTNRLQINYILKSGSKMLGVALISMIATVIVGYLGAKIAAGMGKNIRKDVFRKVIGFSNAEFDKFSTASLITRSTNDINQIQTVMVMLVRMVFYAPILAIGGIIKVLQTDTSMAWIIGIAVLAILSVVIVLFSLAIPRFKIIQNLVDKLNLVTREMLTGMLVIRAFNTQKTEENRFDDTNEKLRKTNTFVNRVMTIMMPTMMLIMNLITVLIVWVGASQIDAGSIQVGDMMAFIQYTMQIIMAFLFISMLSVVIPRASVSASRINEVLTTQYSIKESKDTKKLRYNSNGVVEFKNVSFKYPNAKGNVISDISFTAYPGQTTAFIGSTGSGKSTLVNLIPRFYDVVEGKITIDGVDIRDLKQSELRERIGYVPQKGVLFSGTIESNIKYGAQNISDDEIKKVSQIAQAMEFIYKKPLKYKEEIAQGGTNVSGGQKQRLSIARALAKKPDIYIFDDSFSALDLKTDAKLRKELKLNTDNATVLIVAQRISTIMNAEQIIVLDEGKIVGKGTHKELIKNCEVYKQIASSQLSKEELGHE